MPKQSSVQRKDQPYLTTPDVERLTGVSRRSLESYVKAGIITPRRSSQASNADMMWTFEQAALATRIKQLVREDFTLAQAADLHESGSATTIDDAAYERQVRGNRESRREVKDSVNHRRKVADTLKLGRIDGPYLRYVPQRWLALIPAPAGQHVQPNTREYISLASNLNEVVQVVGWSATMDFGTVASLTADMAVGTSYASVTLASPAMPTITGEMVIDGGCYRVIDDSVDYPECDGVSCFECARFGRVPTEKELERWKAAEIADPHIYDRTVMMDDLAEPYPAGMWSGYTSQMIEARKTHARYVHGRESRRGPSLRPRLMPHEVKLPCGVTSCVMPAGIHLCLQCDEGGYTGAYHQLLGMAMSIQSEVFTVEEEIAQYEQATSEGPWRAQDKRNAKRGARGPIIEPFAIPRITGDPNMEGWNRRVTQPEIRALVLPTHMALAPEDGFCITCQTLPQTDANAPTRHELSFVVRCPEIQTPPPGRR